MDADQQSQELLSSIKARKVRMVVKYVEGEDNEGNLTINDYVFKKKLGQGSYGEVFLLQKIINQVPKQFAVKTLRRKAHKKKNFLNKKNQSTNKVMDEDVRNQIAAMKKIRHYNIVGINQVICNEDKDDLYIVMEYCQNAQLIEWNEDSCKFEYTNPEKKNSLTQKQLRRIARDCCKGLQCIFLNGALHRDLKPQNILFDSEYNAKICDFGVSKLMSIDDEDILNDIKGTIFFQSPCLLKNRKRIKGRAADVWALGVTLYCFAYLKHPFLHNPDSDDIIEDVMDNILNQEPEFPPNPCVSKGFIDLVKKMLQKDPEYRITMKDILLHPWVNTGYPMNAHDELLKDMKIMLEQQASEKPVLSVYQVGLIKDYVFRFRARKAARQAELKKSLENIQSSPNLGPMLRKKTSKFTFDHSKPLLTLKIYLESCQFIIVVRLFNESILRFKLYCKKQEWDTRDITIETLEQTINHHPNKRWTKEDLCTEVKKLVRLIKITDKRMTFRGID